MEPFRWLVDYAVLSLATQKSRHRISKKQYSHKREGNIVFEYDLIRIFLEALKRTFQKERSYRFNHGKQRPDGLLMCQEITIAKLTVQSLADYCCGNSKSFLEDNPWFFSFLLSTMLCLLHRFQILFLNSSLNLF